MVSHVFLKGKGKNFLYELSVRAAKEGRRWRDLDGGRGRGGKKKSDVSYMTGAGRQHTVVRAQRAALSEAGRMELQQGKISSRSPVVLGRRRGIKAEFSKKRTSG